MQKFKLVSIDEVRPSAYNPRQAIPERLDMIELSLTKLGFLMPIFADSNGEILSGHQRHHVATRMGLKKIPVCFTKEMTLEERKAINIVFNRATNDFSRDATSKKVSELLGQYDVADLAERIEDKDIHSDEIYPCMNMEKQDIKPLLKKNVHRFQTYSKRLANTLYAKGILMPIIIDEDNNVVNGIGRLEMLAEKGFKEVEVVRVSNEQSRLSYALLNLLSMEFDLHNRYRDVLRHNSFRRAVTNRAGIGLGFVASLYGRKKRSKDLVDMRKYADEWKEHYGTTVVDFGAGHLTDTKILRDIGVRVSAFEPYYIKPGTDKIDLEASRELTRKFLNDVKRGVEYDSIFISSVLNSVPYREDREKIVIILSALSSEHTKTYAWTMAVGHQSHRNIYADGLAERSANEIRFMLDYEDNIIIGNISKNPKVQKYHTPKELYELFKLGFKHVKVEKMKDSLLATCQSPTFTKEQLIEALEFEFNMPYPDGSKMGLVKEAKEAFSERLGMEL